MGGLAAFAGARWFTDVDYWALDSENRRAVNAVQRSAMPSGRADVDRLALQRLATAARQQRGQRVLLPIFLLTVWALPFIAAWRVRDSWYLLTLGGALAATGFGLRTVTRRPASARHAELLKHLAQTQRHD